MDYVVVEGGHPLHGEVSISGAKNAALPIMAASLLTTDSILLTNIPNRLSDVKNMGHLLINHGVNIEVPQADPNRIMLSARKITNFEAPYDIVRRLRASIWVLAPLVARYGKARVSLPGGCVIGVRQIDLHLDVLRAMGAEISLNNGYVEAQVPSKRLRGTHFTFSKVSVGATISAIMAASLADGQTTLGNCAHEPEIVNLCQCLTMMGAKIDGIGTDKLVIEGVDSLGGAVCPMIPDRIETGTYMAAAAITGGMLKIVNIEPLFTESFNQKLIQCGIKLIEGPNYITVDARDCILTARDMDTAPYPGIATDLQAQFMSLMTISQGTSIIRENIFENRMMHVPELCRMGANIQVSGNTAIVKGVPQLKGADVMASDLRASVSLIIAGLAAEGITTVRRVYHLDRGYERLEEKLRNCGAIITRKAGDVV